jgi:hypothetical protein
MGIVSAFQAQGKTYKANVTTSSQTILVTSDSPCNQVCVANHESSQGGQPVYFNISSASNVTATVPVAGTPSYCLVSVPGTTKTFTVPQQFTSTGLYIAFIGENNSECYFTPGEGI